MVGRVRAWLGTRALLVALAGLAAFAPVVTYGFAYDDAWTIERNESLDRSLRWLVRKLVAGQGVLFHIPDATRPVMVVTSWFDRHLWGSWAGGYHLVSLVLYVVVVVLAFLSIFGLSRRRTVALVGGLFFALAPVHAEAVAAINYREDLLAAVGVLGPLAWLMLPKARIERPLHQLGFALLWGVGLFGKESAVVLPLLLVAACLVDRRFRVVWIRNEAALFALFGMFIVWANWRVALLLGGDDIPRAGWAPLDDVLLSTARFETRAVFESLFPLSAAPEYSKEGPASWLWGLAALGVSILVLQLARGVRTRRLALGLAIAALAALPASPLVGPANARADRYLFISILGGAIFWGEICALVRRFVSRRSGAAALVAACVALGFACGRAERPWRDDYSLWARAVEQAPSSPRAWTGLSRALRLRGDVNAAKRAVDHALYLDDTFVPARVTRTYTLIALGDPSTAEQELERLKREGNGDFRGVANAARCLHLPRDRVRACIMER